MTETEALQAALAGEHAAVYGFGVLAARSAGAVRSRARRAYDEHRSARDRLSALLVTRGAVPVAAAAAYSLAVTGRSAPTTAEQATGIEDRLAGPYADLVGASASPLRDLAVAALAATAVRAAGWSGRAQAFPGLSSAVG